MALNTEHLGRCIQTLESSLKLLNQSEMGSTEYEIYRNAAVKGFELTLEISGKLLKKAIRPFFATPKAADRLTFKNIFRQAAKYDFLSVEEVERWFAYRDNRNVTTHDYGVGFAEETMVLLPDFVTDAKKLREKLGRADT
ncbi:nucleotidyltransferase substrate binding protein [bacterium]|nr:nucleotidyltransferase substrate binding protein [bacterium]